MKRFQRDPFAGDVITTGGGHALTKQRTRCLCADWTLFSSDGMSSQYEMGLIPDPVNVWSDLSRLCVTRLALRGYGWNPVFETPGTQFISIAITDFWHRSQTHLIILWALRALLLCGVVGGRSYQQTTLLHWSEQQRCLYVTRSNNFIHLTCGFLVRRERRRRKKKRGGGVMKPPRALLPLQKNNPST